jgi:hypothetical protein
MRPFAVSVTSVLNLLLWLSPLNAAVCQQPLPQLAPHLLQDLPAYLNRLRTRANQLTDRLIATGVPEYDPLPLPADFPAVRDPENIHQVFFTSLERPDNASRAVSQQGFHWLLLTPTPQGWRFLGLYSRQGSSSDPSLSPEPLRDANRSLLGQAIRLWLRDCRAGTL